MKCNLIWWSNATSENGIKIQHCLDAIVDLECHIIPLPGTYAAVQ